MKRSDINPISQVSQDALNAMRNARSATIEFQQALTNHAALDGLKLLADKAAAAHADAVSDARKLETSLKSAGVAGVASAMTAAMDKVQTAAASAQQVKAETGQAAAAAIAAAAAAPPAVAGAGPAPAVLPPALSQLAQAAKLADDDAVARLQDVEAAFKYSDEYEEASANWLSSFTWSAVGKWLGGAVIVVIAILLMGQIQKTFSADGKLLENLARIEYARGVITFLLSLGTVVIAIMLVLGMLLSDGKDESDRKFNRAKEVLTVLVGIFGTILGFYFGTATSSQSVTALGLSPLAIARSPDGSTTTVAGIISGGKPPYVYNVTFRNDEIPAIKNQISRDGPFTIVISNAPAGKSVGYTISVSDSWTNHLDFPAKEEQFIKGK